MVDFSSDEEDEEFEHTELNKNTNEKNKLLAVGNTNKTSNRAFVVRGDKIGVFSSSGDDLKFSTAIENMMTPEKKTFSPRRLMLHDADKDMLMLGGEKDKIYHMDLERGQVVDEWDTQGQALSTILPESKYAQSTPQKTLLGLNNSGFFLIDPRVSGKSKIVRSRCFQYSAGANSRFNCGVTTDQGDLAVGSKNGDIKLFNAKSLQGDAFTHHSASYGGLSKAPRAKTRLPGFGDPILAIDVTADGKWILATCKTYLLVIPTSTSDGRSGFTKAMGKEKPFPRRLQLKRDHVKLLGGNISFTPARFNMGANAERSIVTSTGPFVVTWNFRKVKQNVLDHYQIKKYAQDVVADQFTYGEDRKIVVAMPDDVRLAKRHSVVNVWSPPKTPQK